MSTTPGASGYAQSFIYGTTGNLVGNGEGMYYGQQRADCPSGALSKPHALVTLGYDLRTYCYDASGNVNRRTVSGVSTAFVYDAQQQLTSASGGTSASYVYDGDGQRVKATVNGTTTAYVGTLIEWDASTSTLTKYYYANGQRIAMRVGGTVKYLLSDHLGSTSLALNSTGGILAEQRYKAYGEARATSGTLPTASSPARSRTPATCCSTTHAITTR